MSCSVEDQGTIPARDTPSPVPETCENTNAALWAATGEPHTWSQPPKKETEDCSSQKKAAKDINLQYHRVFSAPKHLAFHSDIFVISWRDPIWSKDPSWASNRFMWVAFLGSHAPCPGCLPYSSEGRGHPNLSSLTTHPPFNFWDGNLPHFRMVSGRDIYLRVRKTDFYHLSSNQEPQERFKKLKTYLMQGRNSAPTLINHSLRDCPRMSVFSTALRSVSWGRLSPCTYCVTNNWGG